MNHTELAELLFPHINQNTEDFEALYPPRNLPKEAKVTRLGPSPTGFIHLGNLYGAFADERLAHQSGGLFYLRIEDTDDKREVEGAVPAILSSLDHFGISFDEGATIEGEKGSYGPYYQSQRGHIYQAFAKRLVAQGLAYPCFCTEEELQATREKQEAAKENPGYYGPYATCRTLSADEAATKVQSGLPYVIRFRSFGDAKKYFELIDGIRGPLSMPENDQDIILLKQNGIPTYHFAHVVDDHLMRTTHVVRGEEWLSSLPIHVALFHALQWELPIYCHTTVLMKMEGETKRKLSKRKDPELSLNYYRNQGYHPVAVREYLLTILNSNYEEWRMEHPTQAIEEFLFTTEKMSNSGTLFDLDKLNDISKEVLVQMSDEALYDFLLSWSKEHRPQVTELFMQQKEKLIRILGMDRHGEKPRKDLIYCDQILQFISYFFEEYFVREDSYPDQVDERDLALILESYLSSYRHEDDQAAWFDKIRELAVSLGYAAKPKDYKKEPERYKGHVGDVSTVIRIALMGRSSSPDLWEIQQIMGEAMTRERMERALLELKS